MRRHYNPIPDVLVLLRNSNEFMDELDEVHTKKASAGRLAWMFPMMLVFVAVLFFSGFGLEGAASDNIAFNLLWFGMIIVQSVLGVWGTLMYFSMRARSKELAAQMINEPSPIRERTPQQW